MYRKAVVENAQVEKWLRPSEAGALEAEGLERTGRFRQEDIVDALDETSKAKVKASIYTFCFIYMP